MASANQSKRLRRISDMFSGNHKKVLTEVDRILKKSPTFAAAKVVKALALIRMDKTEEARVVLNDIRETVTDPVKLANLMMKEDKNQSLLRCYKELHEPETICAIFEQICKTVRTEEVFVQYFLSLVRVDNYAKMRHFALKMFNVFHKYAYFYWAVASLILNQESLIGPIEYSSMISFQLAERMIDEFLLKEMQTGISLKTHEILLDLYIQVHLRYSTNYIKLLNVFQSKGYPPEDLSTWEWDENHETYCIALQRSGKTVELLEYLRKLFYQHKQYVILKQVVDIFGDTEKGREFMDYLRDEHESFGVAMANLYYAQQKDELKNPTAAVKQDFEMMIKYGMEQTSFFPDAIEYLKLTDKTTRQEVLSKMALRHLMDHNLSKNTLRVDLVKDINYELACRDLLNNEWNLEQRLNQALLCFKKYLRLKTIRELVDSKKKKKEKSGDKQEDEQNQVQFLERYYLDQYVLVAATILISEHCKLEKTDEVCGAVAGLVVGTSKMEDGEKPEVTFGSQLMIAAICFMEQALDENPDNSTLRLILANAYARMGAIKEMLKVLDNIGIKHVQYDTLGYLIFPHLLTSGSHSEAVFTLRQADTLYRDFQTTDVVIAAFENCSFRQVPQFRVFGDHLLRSTQFGLDLVELSLLNYAVCAGTVEQLKGCAAIIERDLNFTEMCNLVGCDNRDLSVLQNIFDDNIDWSVFRDTTLIVEKHWYQTRVSMMIVVTKLINLVDIKDEGSRKNSIEEIQQALAVWETCCQEWDEEIKEKKIEMTYYGISPPLHARDFELKCPNFSLELWKMATELVQENETESVMKQVEAIQDCFVKKANDLLTVLQTRISSFHKDPSFIKIRGLTQDIHWISEFFAISKLILIVLSSKVQQHYSSGNEKKGKGRKSKVGHPAIVSEGTKRAYKKSKELVIDFLAYYKAIPIPTFPNMKQSEDISKMESDIYAEVYNLLSPSFFVSVHKILRQNHVDQLTGLVMLGEMSVQLLCELEKQD